MFGSTLIKIYGEMLALGLTRSKREFARRWLGRGKTYLRDFEFREGRSRERVSLDTVSTLRTRLCAISARMPDGICAEIAGIVHDIDCSVAVANLLMRAPQTSRGET
ncbi:DUF6626 family protein [Microvirga terricola]|uniref:DUF6626 family protein n=1 Tax=Microvirga terricola TaxID=2719797 RepID=UPI003CCE7D2B